MSRIHSTAVIDPGAEIHESVEIGPYCVIGRDVRIGAGTRLLSHVNICDHSRIGENNVIHMGAVIGHLPQFLGFDPATVSYTVIGHENQIREYVTIHRSIQAEGETRIGNGNFLMGLSHVAHDCTIGNDVVIANGTGLAGHVSVGDRAFISGITGVHQYARIGTMAMVSGLTRVTKDAPPYMTYEGDGYVVGVNIVGLRRAGVGADTRAALNRAYHIVFRSGLSVSNALQALRLEWEGRDMPQELKHFIEFCAVKSKRGLGRSPRGRSASAETANE